VIVSILEVFSHAIYSPKFFSFAAVVSQIVFDTNRSHWPFSERVIILQICIFDMEEKRTMPICFTSDQLKLIEDYAKRKGMLNLSQAVEHLVTK